MPAISVRSDWDAERVRAAARLAQDAGQGRRLLAIAAIYDGMSRAAAARLGGMERQTLREKGAPVQRRRVFGAGRPTGAGPRAERGAGLAALDAARPLSGSRGGTGP